MPLQLQPFYINYVRVEKDWQFQCDAGGGREKKKKKFLNVNKNMRTGQTFKGTHLSDINFFSSIAI